jgi:molybdopterin-guanine dinucleotide biosynthesis protein A
MINNDDITGIILAGGKSNRMGKDKGLCSFNGKPLVEYAINSLKPLCHNIIISANNNLDKYSKYGIQVVPDDIKNIGPMGGIYSCLKVSTTQHNIVLSCDTPFINTNLLKYLLKNVYNEQVVAAAHHKFLIEPLSAYYATNVLSDINKAIMLKDFKLINLFKKVRFKSVNINELQSFYNNNLFLNINCPVDLKYAEEISNFTDNENSAKL